MTCSAAANSSPQPSTASTNGHEPDATPAQEEITRIRRLINRIKGDLAELGGTENTAIDEAIAVLRKHRAVNLAMPAVRPAQPRTPAQIKDVS